MRALHGPRSFPRGRGRHKPRPLAQRRGTLHRFYLYQIIHLPVKKNLRTNYAIMYAFSVRLCKNAELVYLCSYALTPITHEIQVTK